MQSYIVTSEQLSEDPEQFDNYFCAIAQETNLIDQQVIPVAVDTEHWFHLIADSNNDPMVSDNKLNLSKKVTI